MAVLKRFSSHSNTIYDCCKVVCLILFALGCCGLTKQQEYFNYNRKTVFFMWLAAFWHVTSLITCAHVKFQSTQVENFDTLIKSIFYLEMVMSVIMYFTTVMSMYLNINKNLKLYATIQHLDEKLLNEFSCRLNYKKLRRKHYFIMSFGVAVYMTVIIAAVWQTSSVQEFLLHLFAGLSYTAVTGGPHLIGYAQMNMAEILSIRFRVLQKLLTKPVVCSSKLSSSQQIDCLRSLICFVKEYHNCIRQVNEVYSASLVTTMLHDFTLTTSDLYLNLGSKKTHSESVLTWFVSVCIILPVCKMTIAPVCCDKSKREGDKCFQILKNAEFWFPRRVEVRRSLSSCMLWRIDNKTEFLSGTMKFNKQVIVVVYSQIINYLLILIQFRMTQEMGDEIDKQKNTIQEWIGVDYI